MPDPILGRAASEPTCVVLEKFGVVIVLPCAQSRERSEQSAANVGDRQARSVGLARRDPRPLDHTPTRHRLDGGVEPATADTQRDEEVLTPARRALQFNEDRDQPFPREELKGDLALARIYLRSAQFWQRKVADLCVSHP